MPTLRQQKAQARELVVALDFARALRACDQILAQQPLDYETRLGIADLLARLDARREALAVYQAVAQHDIRAGHPLPALVAAKAVEGLGGPADEIYRALADTYAHDGGKIAPFAARQAPVDLEVEGAPLDLASDEPLPAVIERAAARALDLSAFVRYPEQYLPLPFFSELPSEVFAPVLHAATVRRLAPGTFVVREGEPGTAFFLVAAGEVRVFATDSLGQERDLARLHENALFGEMALLTHQPRSASVVAVSDVDVVEIGRDALRSMASELPVVAAALDRFARQRLLKNLFATSPIFRPFNRQQQLDLIRRFDGHDVAPGTEIIREGAPGMGLFIVLSGEVEVVKHQDGAEVPLARLRAGEVFGEMSLLREQPTTATVRAARQATVLFLAREYFQRLTEALPQIRAAFEAIAERRDLDTKLTLGLDDEIEIDEDDLVRI